MPSYKQIRFWLILGLVVLGLVGGLAAIGFLIYLSGERQLSQLEVVLFTVIISVIQILLGLYGGYLVSKESARGEYKPFVRSALRRTYGLSEGVSRVQDSVREGIRRMSGRQAMDPQSREQLWAEILNSFHSQLNEVLRQAQASIDDWREFGPDELEELEESQRAKEEQIAAIRERLRELYELMGELADQTTTPEPAVGRLERVAETLERDLENLRSRSVLAPVGASPTESESTRDLMLRGAYDEAIDAYARRIRISPTSHTLYIGRARARYLAGDKQGALEDLDKAEELNPEDPVIERVRGEISEDRLLSPLRSSSARPWLPSVVKGHRAVSRGDDEAARRFYAEAQELGISTPYHAVNVAMVEILECNSDDARDELGRLDPEIAGDVMAVNLAALSALTYAVQGEAEGHAELVDVLDESTDYDYSRSPLKYLEAGLQARDLLLPEVKEVLDHLQERKEETPNV